MPKHITIATANTYFGTLLADPEGLAVFRDLKVEVVMLQEVHTLTFGQLAGYAEAAGYELGAFDQSSGLAILTYRASGVKVADSRLLVIEPVGRIGAIAMRYNLPYAERFRHRAYLSADLVLSSGQKLKVATTHLIIFARYIARKRQIRALTSVVMSDYGSDLPFVLAGDMNHYPSPRQADSLLTTKAQLQRAELPAPTWSIKGSSYEWLARIGAVIMRKSVSSFDAELDALLYNEALMLTNVRVVDIPSDHRAIVASLSLGI